MCLENIKGTKANRRIGYKIFNEDEIGKLYGAYSHQPFEKSTEIWQGALWGTLKDVKLYSGINSIFIHSDHLKKISVILNKKSAMKCFVSADHQIWKVKLKYKKLLVGNWEGDNCALVDQIRLVEKIK